MTPCQRLADGALESVPIGSPEGLAISPDGANVYVAAFANSAIDVLSRGKKAGKVKKVRKKLRAAAARV